MNFCKVIYIVEIFKYLKIKNFNNLLLVNKKLNELKKKENIWKYYCEDKFNKKFWIDAKKKNSKNSLGNWRKEYVRIIKFENLLKKNKFSLWKIKDYYAWWDTLNLKTKNF